MELHSPERAQSLSRGPAQHVSSLPTERLASIDALRGFSIFWIIGGDDMLYQTSQLIIDSLSITAAAQGDGGRRWTCAMAAAVFRFDGD